MTSSLLLSCTLLPPFPVVIVNAAFGYYTLLELDPLWLRWIWANNALGGYKASFLLWKTQGSFGSMCTSLLRRRQQWCGWWGKERKLSRWKNEIRRDWVCHHFLCTTMIAALCTKKYWPYYTHGHQISAIHCHWERGRAGHQGEWILNVQCYLFNGRWWQMLMF